MYTLRRSHFRSVVSVTIFPLIGFLFTLYRLSTRGFHLLQKQVQFFLSSFVSERCERIPRFYVDIWRTELFKFCTGTAGKVRLLFWQSWLGANFVPVQLVRSKFCFGKGGSVQVLYPSCTADLVQILYRYSWLDARFVLIKRKGVSF